MATKSMFIEEIKKSAKNKSILGFSVFYSVEGVEVTSDKLRKVFKTAKVSDEFLPPQITQKKAFTKCLEKLKKTPGIMVRKIKAPNGGERPNLFAYRVVSEKLTTDNIQVGDHEFHHDTEYEKDNLIIFDREEGSISFHVRKFKKEVKEAFEEIYENQIYYTRDIRRMLDEAVVRLGGIKIIQRGGGWFVPLTNYNILGSIEDACRNIPGIVKFLALPIARNKQSEERTKKVAIDTIKDQLSGYEEELKDFDWESPKAHIALRNKIEKFGQLRTLAQLHADNLRFDAEDIEVRINKMEKVIANGG